MQLDEGKLSLSPAEAAKALGISERHLFTLTKAGIVPHVKLGRRVIYPVDQLRAWLAEQTQQHA